ncbi:hypothetical protein [Mesobacillus jeotgali]|uniref:hypothetical protein n=1 Tax=Mesobacillus jeotgali TaxID=129985 RepID=UPI0009A85E15|nr:hypothetical protein [Mesobacillus jeotgali]
MAPAYHPEWLVNFWLAAPGLNLLNPHFVLIFFGAVVTLNWFYQRKNRSAPEDTEEEQLFRHLLLRKKVIEEELAGLPGRLVSAEITEETFNNRKLEYHRQLTEVNKELEQYT